MILKGLYYQVYYMFILKDRTKQYNEHNNVTNKIQLIGLVQYP